MSDLHYTESKTSTTWDEPNGWLLNVHQDDNGSWVVSERLTDTWGAGDSLLEAFVDFWAALGSTLGMMEEHELSPRLERQREQIKKLRQRPGRDRGVA